MATTLDQYEASKDTLSVPLCVDLDGTLIHTDMLHEAVFMLLRLNIFYLFLLPVWLLKGRAHLKAEIAKRVMPDAANLPYNNALLEWLERQKDAGRELVLATASHQSYAQSVAKHLGLFNSIEASWDDTNLASSVKAERLKQRFGEKGFDYAGNGSADIKVWDKTRRAVVVGREAAARRYAKRDHAQSFTDNAPKAGLKTWLKAIRVHQWLKNSLLFVPGVLASRYFEWTTAVDLMIAFLSFSFCASSVYLINDLLDIDLDRKHRTKHKRPIAAGLISVSQALTASVFLLMASVALSLTLPLLFTGVLGLYFAITCAYSVLLKRLLLIDVLTLAGLFTIRVLAGSAAIEGVVSTWLLAFCVFFFLSLALVKRFVEISGQLSGVSRESTGRGYQTIDLETLGQAGMTSGFASVVVLALFIDSPQISNNYAHPQLIWLVCPLVLYLLMRIWILARRNQMNDDPVVFLMTDWRSQIMIAAGAILMLISQAM